MNTTDSPICTEAGATPAVISHIVNADLCIGCGVCIPVCPERALTMRWNDDGLYEPAPSVNRCAGCRDCLSVCPFADGTVPGVSLPDETQIAASIGEWRDDRLSPTIGRYRGLYAGHAPTFRAEGSSGGLTTWFLTTLLRDGHVDGVICLAPAQDDNCFFSYSVCRTPDELLSASKTKYYPAHAADAVSFILETEGKYAMTALPCTLKAIRLLQRRNDVLNARLVCLAGIICGGLKSVFFTEYLASKADGANPHIIDPRYRIKDDDTNAGDYSFGCANPQQPERLVQVKMRTVGDMWGTGLFKPNACDYCDDLTAELADVSFGDAWIDPYRNDGRGTNVVIIRSPFAEKVFHQGLSAGELVLDRLSEKQVVLSQQGNYNHRRTGLAYRLYWALQEGTAIPRKRVVSKKPWNPLLARIHRLRMQVRRDSFTEWKNARGQGGSRQFDLSMSANLQKLASLTNWSHRMRWSSISRRLKRLFHLGSGKPR